MKPRTRAPYDTTGTSSTCSSTTVRTGETTRVSVSSSGAQAEDNHSLSPAISANGRYVAFHSLATDLVPGDTNSRTDVFVHDRQTGLTTRVSLGPGGRQSNDHSADPTISGDGRFVAFRSFASNLVPGDTNGVEDIFLRDRQTGMTYARERRPQRQAGQRAQHRPGAFGEWAGWWSSSPRPKTWCRATPTRRRTSSSACAEQVSHGLGAWPFPALAIGGGEGG